MEITHSTHERGFKVYHLHIPVWIEPEGTRKKYPLSFKKYHKQISDQLTELFRIMTQDSKMLAKQNFTVEYFQKINLSKLFSQYWILMTYDKGAQDAARVRSEALKEIGGVVGRIVEMHHDERIKHFGSEVQLFMIEVLQWFSWFVIRIDRARSGNKIYYKELV